MSQQISRDPSHLTCSEFYLGVNQALLVLQESHGNGDEDRRSDVGDEPSESKLSVQRRSLDYDYFCPVGKSRQSTIRYNCHMFNMYLSLPMNLDRFLPFRARMSSARSPLSSSPSQRHKFILPRLLVARTVRTRTWRAIWRSFFRFLVQ